MSDPRTAQEPTAYNAHIQITLSSTIVAYGNFRCNPLLHNCFYSAGTPSSRGCGFVLIPLQFMRQQIEQRIANDNPKAYILPGSVLSAPAYRDERDVRCDHQHAGAL